MKKLFALMLAAALALSLAACGGGAGDNNTSGTGNGDTASVSSPGGDTPLPANDLDTITDIYNWLVGDVWNDGICDVGWYYVDGTSATGDELDIEFALEQLAKAMEQKEAYDEYMAGLTGDYEELGSLWKRVSEQVDLVYAEISEREPAVTGEGLESGGLYDQYFDAFSKEYDRLWEANQ